MLETTLALQTTPDTALLEFALADWHDTGSVDLVAIQQRTSDNAVKIQVFSEASTYTETLLETVTPLLQDIDAFYLFRSGANKAPDLLAVKRSKTKSGKTEVSILSGDSEFQTVSLHTSTALEKGSEALFEFVCAATYRLS